MVEIKCMQHQHPRLDSKVEMGGKKKWKKMSFSADSTVEMDRNTDRNTPALDRHSAHCTSWWPEVMVEVRAGLL